MQTQHDMNIKAAIGSINLLRKGQSVTAEITLCIEDAPDEIIMALLSLAKKTVRADITESVE